jgi:hypothetical protein
MGSEPWPAYRDPATDRPTDFEAGIAGQPDHGLFTTRDPAEQLRTLQGNTRNRMAIGYLTDAESAGTFAENQLIMKGKLFIQRGKFSHGHSVLCLTQPAR